VLYVPVTVTWVPKFGLVEQIVPGLYIEAVKFPLGFTVKLFVDDCAEDWDV
jgi:hypothetical protein